MFAAWLPNTRWVGRTHHGWSHRCSTCSPSGTRAWLSCQAIRAAWVARPRSGSWAKARPSGRASAPNHGQHPSGPSSTTDTLTQNLAASIGTGHTLPRFGAVVTDLFVSLTYVRETKYRALVVYELERDLGEAHRDSPGLGGVEHCVHGAGHEARHGLGDHYLVLF